MRLFIAINFDDTVKNQINTFIHHLQPYAQQGRFVDKERLHMTLEFLGDIEASRIKEITDILDDLEYAKFTLHASRLGFFTSRKSKVYWLGIQESQTLTKLQKELHQELLHHDFVLEERSFTPHITIGRKMKLKKLPNFQDAKNAIKNIKIQVTSIDLMESTFEEGQLNYKVIASKQLAESK